MVSRREEMQNNYSTADLMLQDSVDAVITMTARKLRGFASHREDEGVTIIANKLIGIARTLETDMNINTIQAMYDKLERDLNIVGEDSLLGAIKKTVEEHPHCKTSAVS